MKNIITATSLFLAASTATYANSNDKFMAIIDAGSSGSRIHVFEISQQPNSAVPAIHELTVDNPKVKPGLSSFVNNPQDSGASLTPLLDNAKTALVAHGANPHTTALYLMATAGMRLVPTAEQKAIYDNVKQTLGNTDYTDVKTVGTIPGYQEGEFGWLAINYNTNDHSFPAPWHTTGALDLGGASTQITYEHSPNAIAKVDPSDIQTLTIGNNQYTVFAHSFLGFGQDQARTTIMPFYHHDFSACYPKNYSDDGQPELGTSTGFSWNKCSAEIKQYVRQNHINQIVPFDATTKSFTAFSGYAFTLQFFNANNPNELEAAAKTQCTQSWQQFQGAHQGVDPKYLANYCFNAAYITTLAKTGYHYSPLTTYKVTGDAQDWTLDFGCGFVFESCGLIQ